MHLIIVVKDVFVWIYIMCMCVCECMLVTPPLIVFGLAVFANPMYTNMSSLAVKINVILVDGKSCI